MLKEVVVVLRALFHIHLNCVDGVELVEGVCSTFI